MKILQALRSKACCAALLAVGTFGAVSPVLAHHSFTMFDMTKRLTLVGTITSFEWTNPHSYIEIDVPDEKGAVKHWSIEMGVRVSSCKAAGSLTASKRARNSR